MNSFIDKLAGNNRYALLFLAGISLFFFIGLGLLHLFDWDEINFAESAREMIASGDYMRVQINYSPFWEKPPFFFWLQVGSMKLFGINEFAARFPNALFGFIYLITFYYIGKKHFSAKFGLIWALLFFGSLLPHIYFKSGIIDPVFNYFIFLSIYYMLLVVGKSKEKIVRYALLAGIFSGLSVITKGPVGFLLLGLTFSAYMIVTRFKVFPKIKYIGLFLAGILLVICSWLAIELYQNGIDIVLQFIEYQLELFNSSVAGHEQPFYYHFVVVFLGCFPISLFALPSFKPTKETSPFDLRVWMLCLFWVVIILFSLSTTKIIHYSSMTYIPLSFLACLFIYRAIKEKAFWKKYVSVLFLIVGLLLAIVFTVLPILLQNKEELFPYINDPFAVESLKTTLHWSGYEFLIGLFFGVSIIVTFLYFRKREIIKGITLTAISLATTLLLILFFVIPKIESFTQGPVVGFYEKIQGEDCYVESYGYKSYAQYYYFQQPFGLDDKRKDQQWLLTGGIDKPVYLVSKSTNTELDAHPNFKRIKAEGGFIFYKREP